MVPTLKSKETMPPHSRCFRIARFALMAISFLVVVQLLYYYTGLFRDGNDSQQRRVRGETLIHTDATSGRLFKMTKVRRIPQSDYKFQQESIQKQYPSVWPSGDFWNRKDCHNWAVVTTIFEPSEAVARLVQDFQDHPGWCLVVSGDRKGPADYPVGGDTDRVVFLSAQHQLELAEKIPFVAITPWNHFARKNVAYLYAIANGAQYIWDFDDDNELVTDKIFRLAEEATEVQQPALIPMVAENCTAINPYPFYGPSTKELIWPRGYPLENIRRQECTVQQTMPFLLESSKIGVYQMLADGDPDVDAIYRQTRPTPLTFRRMDQTDNDHPLIAPHKHYIPFNAQATLWRKNSFWGLLLPITVHGRVSDIWRSYVVQTIYRYIGLYASYMGPHALQVRNVHNYLADFDAEKPLYDRAGVLVQFLLDWKPTSSDLSLPHLLEQLVGDLVEYDILQPGDLTLLQEWLSALLSVGYDVPPLQKEQEDPIGKIEMPPPPPQVPSTELQPPQAEMPPQQVPSEHVDPVQGTAEGMQQQGLAEPWRHTDQPHCYQHGNDWSQCAGDHLMYPKAQSPQALWYRPVMCLFEPLCWLQLDWRTLDPPNVQCPINRGMQFYDWAVHDGTMASLSTTLEQSLGKIAGQPFEVFNCNVKESGNARRNYHYDFKGCPTHPQYVEQWATKASDQLGSAYFDWLQTSPHAQQADAHIVSFIPPIFDFLMSLNRTIIVNALHRVNLYRCSARETQQTFDNLIRLASSGPTGRYPNAPPSIIAPGYIHDVEYIRHYTGIRPLYLPFSLLNVLPHAIGTAEYTGSKKNWFIWNGFGELPADLTTKHHFWVPSGYELSDLLHYQAAIVIPYSITNTKSLEQYELNIPIFAPTPRFAMELGCFGDRTATYSPYCGDQWYANADHPQGHASSPYEFSPNARSHHGDNAEDELFWISFSEVFRWPCVELFDSWEELGSKLGAATDETYNNMSGCMKQANRWRKYELESNTCWALQTIASAPHGSTTATSYAESLDKTFGVQHLFDI